MSHLKYSKAEIMSLKDHPELTETWVRERIEEDPSILGLGDVELKDTERRQPRAGRLDLPLEDPEEERRYEVELQLGSTDESHIIRAVEYWDIERKRYPRYEHRAVLIAENITRRFLNVVGLLNRTIPFIAIQVTALKVGDQIVLQFVKVLDEFEWGGEEEIEEDLTPPADRAYWERRAPKTMPIVDQCFDILEEVEKDISPNYRKQWIGLAVKGRVRNFVMFHPKKQFVRVSAKTGDRQTWAEKLKAAGIDVLAGGTTSVRFRLTEGETKKHRAILSNVFRAARKYFME